MKQTKKRVLTLLFASQLLVPAFMLIASMNVSALPAVLQGGMLFESDRDGNSEIYTANSDGSNATNLTNNPAIDVYPDWSPDGTRILFTSFRDGSNSDLYVMNADGTNVTALTTADAGDRMGRWSPDGTRIVYSHWNGTDEDLYVMNADGTGAVAVANSASYETWPDWSPDGTQIVYRQDTGADYDIFIMNDDGSNATNLTNTPTDNESNPHVSPDGTLIAFDNNPTDANREVYTMNLDGTNVTVVGSNAAADSFSSWSPDGTRMYFQTDRDGNEETYSMTVAGTSPVNLTNNAGDDTEGQQLGIALDSVVSGLITTTTIDVADDFATYAYTVTDGETLVVNGVIGDITVGDGAILMGSGGTVGNVTVESGGALAPGESPGCLSTSNVTFATGSSYDVEIQDGTACTGYDQMQVTGTVDVTGATLNVTPFGAYDSSTFTAGDEFIIIDNDAADDVTGAFTNYAEGDTVVVGPGQNTFTISYRGGDGNDVVLTFVTADTIPVAGPTVDPTATPGTPDTGFGAMLTNPATVMFSTTAIAGAILAIARKYSLLKG